jgi:deazaflavin-dependent oxidoreductase (nitroreductase family)
VAEGQLRDRRSRADVAVPGAARDRDLPARLRCRRRRRRAGAECPYELDLRSIAEVHDNPTGWVAAHIRRYVESGGRDHTFNGCESLLLTTRGRRSGKLRRTALYFGRDGDRFILVATGQTDPDWYRNLLANPAVVVQVREETFGAIARPATAAERRRLWELMVGVFPRYAQYAEQAGRELPVAVLEMLAP